MKILILGIEVQIYNSLFDKTKNMKAIVLNGNKKIGLKLFLYPPRFVYQKISCTFVVRKIQKRTLFAMLKRLIQLIIDLITNPEKTWVGLSSSDVTPTKFMRDYFYPLLAIISLSVFVGMFRVNSLDLQHCIKLFSVVLVQYFVGFRLAVFLYDELLATLFEERRGQASSILFIGYNFLVLMAIHLVKGFLPAISIFDILPLYVIVVIWYGIKYYINKKERSGALFCSLASLIVLGVPWMVGLVMRLFLPGI